METAVILNFTMFFFFFLNFFLVLLLIRINCKLVSWGRGHYPGSLPNTPFRTSLCFTYMLPPLFLFSNSKFVYVDLTLFLSSAKSKLHWLKNLLCVCYLLSLFHRTSYTLCSLPERDEEILSRLIFDRLILHVFCYQDSQFDYTNTVWR